MSSDNGPKVNGSSGAAKSAKEEKKPEDGWFHQFDLRSGEPLSCIVQEVLLVFCRVLM